MGPIWGRQDPGGPHELCYLGYLHNGNSYTGKTASSYWSTLHHVYVKRHLRIYVYLCLSENIIKVLYHTIHIYKTVTAIYNSANYVSVISHGCCTGNNSINSQDCKYWFQCTYRIIILYRTLKDSCCSFLIMLVFAMPRKCHTRGH